VCRLAPPPLQPTSLWSVSSRSAGVAAGGQVLRLDGRHHAPIDQWAERIALAQNLWPFVAASGKDLRNNQIYLVQVVRACTHVRIKHIDTTSEVILAQPLSHRAFDVCPNRLRKDSLIGH
jgi:hypothetical protein